MGGTNPAGTEGHGRGSSTEVRSIGPDNKPIKEYIALIIQRSNPQFDEIVSRFDSEIAMFNELKP